MNAIAHPTCSSASFPTPFGKDQLREDVLAIYLFQARQAYLFCSQETAWPLAGATRVDQAGALWIGENTAKDLAIEYEMVQDSHFAKALEQQYEFAFRGKVTTGLEPMTYESMHMWVADCLMDLNSSQLVAEWESYGVDLQSAAARCLHVCELANARLVLEGAEPFSYFSGLDAGARRTKKQASETATSIEGLTIRQMSLLSAMEEMSIRTAASRQGPNMLSTFKDEHRRTLVKHEDAKKWLIAKGRYVPIDAEEQVVDLSRTRPNSVRAFNDLVISRIRQLTHDTARRMERLKQLGHLVTERGLPFNDALTREALMDSGLMKAIAGVLEMQPEMLAVRARQAALHEEVLELESLILPGSALKGQ